VREIVIQQRVKEEVGTRAKILSKAIDKFNTLRKELNSIRADIVAFDGTGKEVTSNWSKGQLDKKKKLEEQLSGLSNKIDKALAETATKEDWKKLEEKA
ncbi:unnamed protein product, partial [marine sediment metagenome]